MKCGILTFHNAHNYGAVIQAYALKEIVKSFGINCEIINYRNENIDKRYDAIVKKKRIFIRTRDFRVFLDRYLWNRDVPMMQPCWTTQYSKFETFIDEVLLDGEPASCANPMENEFEKYDAIIVGSDQVWNKAITGGMDPVYYLDVPFKGIRISYAASTDFNSFFDDDIYLRETLGSFDSISVREKRVASEINHRFGLTAYCCIDPSLLLDGSDYDCLIGDYKGRQKKFVFAYFVYEDKKLAEYASFIAVELEIELVELHYYKRRWMKDNNQYADMGPVEFLWHIKNAEFVITNSFHGTALSIVYHKPFYCVYDANDRIDNILECLDLKTRHRDHNVFLKVDDPINYNEVQEKLVAYREYSVNFLKEGLQIK